MPPPPTPEDRPSTRRVALLAGIVLVASALIAWVLLHPDEPAPGTPAALTTDPAGVDGPTSPDTAQGRTSGAFVPPALPRLGRTAADPESAQEGSSRLAGRVVHADGSPAATGRVVAWNGSTGLQAALGSEGAFELPRVTDGTWTFYAEADGLREAAPVPVTVDGDTDEVVVTLQGRSALELTVRDARTLVGVGACTARVEGAGEVRSCDGAGRVTVGPRASGAATLVVEAPGYASRRVQAVFPASGRAPLDVFVSGGATLSGRVVTSGDRPVAGAVVTVARWSMAGGEDPVAKGDPSTISDESGRFALPGLTPGRVAACAVATGFAQACTDERYLPADSGRNDVKLVLGTGGAISGRVVREGGAGVGGAALTLTDLGARRVVGGAQGLDDGSFRFDAVAPGSYTIEASTPSGRALANGVTVVDREETEVELLLGDEALRGSVTTSDGRPAVGARVEARSVAVDGRFARQVVGADGKFELRGLVGGPYVVRASLEGTGSVEKRGVAANSEILLVLGRAGALAGSVRDAEGRAVTDFDLTLVPVAGTTEGAISAGYRRTQVASPDGAFVEQDLPVGRYTLRVETASAPTSSQPVEISADTVTRVQVTLPAGVTVSGRTLVDGQPRAGCRVSEMRRGMGRPSQPGRIVTTREDGVFSVPGLLVGPTGVAANCGDGLVGVKWLDTFSEATTDVTIELTERNHPKDSEKAPEFGGIGLALGLDRDGTPFVRMVSEGGPAFLAGIGRGDRLLTVDGVNVVGQSMEAIIERIRGPIGTAVALQLERAGTPEPYATVVERVRIVASGP